MSRLRVAFQRERSKNGLLDSMGVLTKRVYKSARRLLDTGFFKVLEQRRTVVTSHTAAVFEVTRYASFYNVCIACVSIDLVPYQADS